MKYFRIVKTPPGEAPEWVREAWVGMILPADEPFPIVPVIFKGVVTGEVIEEYPRTFSVLFCSAMSILKESNPQAENWWKTSGNRYFLNDPCAILVFHPDVCEVIE